MTSPSGTLQTAGSLHAERAAAIRRRRPSVVMVRVRFGSVRVYDAGKSRPSPLSWQLPQYRSYRTSPARALPMLTSNGYGGGGRSLAKLAVVTAFGKLTAAGSPATPSSAPRLR